MGWTRRGKDRTSNESDNVSHLNHIRNINIENWKTDFPK